MHREMDKTFWQEKAEAAGQPSRGSSPVPPAVTR
jgi:hypothetical protein